jgi:hypothetical protein
MRFRDYALRRQAAHLAGTNVEQADRVAGVLSLVVILWVFIPGIVEWIVG